MSIDLKEFILQAGADIAGFADLTVLPEDRRPELPSGIAVGIALNPKIVSQIPDGPFMEYVDEYDNTNSRLDEICISVQNLLIGQGYNTIAQTVDHIRKQHNQNSETYALLPHKTIAAISGLGWISKSSLLITKAYGSAVRFTSILTDAPLKTTASQYECLCGDCKICIDNCPANAIKNQVWDAGLDRDDLIDFKACRAAVLERGKKLGETHGTCGICMAVCPHTQRYLKA